jgi:6,7-dimethyl-8-ribityllumazine synthase
MSVTKKSAPQDTPDGRGLRVAVVHAAFNASVVSGLVAGCVTALEEMGVAERAVELVQVPGAFELPVVALAAARSGAFDAVVALGAVVRGETDHYAHIAAAAVSGLAAVARETGVPVGLGVLTVTEMRHARARAALGQGNKGAEAARAAVSTARALVRLASRARRVRATQRARGGRRAARSRRAGS